MSCIVSGLMQQQKKKTLQLLIPDSWKTEIMQMLHNNLQSRHLGIHRTISRMQNRFYWIGYKQDVTKWVQNCNICNSRKQPHRKAKSKIKQYCVGSLMERVALDVICHLPISHKGHRYALVSDYFTKWDEVYPMPDMGTTTLVDNFTVNFVGSV